MKHIHQDGINNVLNEQFDSYLEIQKMKMFVLDFIKLIKRLIDIRINHIVLKKKKLKALDFLFSKAVKTLL